MAVATLKRTCIRTGVCSVLFVCAESGLVHGEEDDAGGDDLSTNMRGNELIRRWSWGSAAERPLLSVD